MTVHMVRVHLEPPKRDVETAVNQWVANHPEWTADPVEHTLTTVETGDGTEHVLGNYRFEQSTGQTALLDDLEARLSTLQVWYRIQYHICDYDEPEPDGCTWDETRESGTVPV